MSVRLTGGRHRGRIIAHEAPGGVRPTAGKVRQALFNMIGQELTGWTVLDAFGGTGLLGFEAWSRGADRVTICESNAAAWRAIEASASELGADVEIVRGDVARLLGRRAWDLVLLDPPYATDPLPWLERVAPAARRVVALEHDRARAVPAAVADRLVLDRTRTYGTTALTIYDVGTP
jgi:16S rRNA (guanine(966)-N(2))-methyltransferase RsmD